MKVVVRFAGVRRSMRRAKISIKSVKVIMVMIMSSIAIRTVKIIMVVQSTMMADTITTTIAITTITTK